MFRSVFQFSIVEFSILNKRQAVIYTTRILITVLNGDSVSMLIKNQSSLKDKVLYSLFHYNSIIHIVNIVQFFIVYFNFIPQKILKNGNVECMFYDQTYILRLWIYRLLLWPSTTLFVEMNMKQIFLLELDIIEGNFTRVQQAYIVSDLCRQ